MSFSEALLNNSVFDSVSLVMCINTTAPAALDQSAVSFPVPKSITSISSTNRINAEPEYPCNTKSLLCSKLMNSAFTSVGPQAKAGNV